ncbi:MAG: hypothetical protein Q8O86_10980 [Dehalococcoidia bacterium]|nr:hypothetical protein [Dehalococcoidia bacterium]
MPKRVSGTPNRPHKKPKKRAPGRVVAPAATPIRTAAPERQRVEMSSRPPAAVKARAAAAPVVNYHYVVEDLKRIGIIVLALFVVLGVLAVFLR